jgi:UDP-4-amino-4,6-dideoxy-N-acetyl-beta-L-altrosamine transaminase
MIPYSKQDITEDDIQAVVKTLKSDFLTQGDATPFFEKSLCQYTGSQFSVAVNSGTSALHVACLSLDLGKGDWLWTTAVSFVASANCGLYCGAKVDFVDIDPNDWNLSIHNLKRKLKIAKQGAKLPKVLIVVHLCGQSANMNELSRLAKEYNFKIIEDACHALGGKYLGKPIGSCIYSDITVFSFHPVKSITTGEGGAATTNNLKLAETMRLLRSHGITRDHKFMIGEPHGAWHYQQICLGYNYRLSDIQSALGTSQLSRIDDYIKKRNLVATYYDQNLDLSKVSIQLQDEKVMSSRHLYVIRLNEDKVKKNRQYVFEKLRDANIGVNVHYIPIYRQPFYQKFGYSSLNFKESEKYYAEAISIPIYPSLEKSQQRYIVETINKLT